MRIRSGLVCLVLALCVLLGASAETVEYTGPEWTYALSLKRLKTARLDLCNADHPLTAEDVPADLISLRARRNNDVGENANGGVYLSGGGTVQLDRTCAHAVQMLMSAAERAGLTLYLRLGYRSYSEQKKRYDRAVKAGNMTGVQPAGEADYQTGLSVVLVGRDWRGMQLTKAFAETAEYAWLAENAVRFGFVFRYPEGKEAITGNDAEPWHLRYVGEGVAGYMKRKEYCLEEFVNEVNQAYLDFEAAGGDLVAAELAQQLPEGPIELAETGPDGDAEIILFHD